MGCPVFYGMGVFLCNISTFALAFDGPLTTGHCSLLIAHCKLFHPPLKEIPRCRPPGIPYFAIPYAWMGACAGEGLAGGGPRGTGLSRGGGSLQGLSQRWDSYQAGLSKVFSIGYEFIRRLRAFQTERAISAMRIPAAAAAGLMCMENSPFCFDLVPAVADTGCAEADAGDGCRDLL